MTGTSRPAYAFGEYLIGGDLPVCRLGYGTMQLTGPGHWYHPADPDAAKRLLRRVVELGINHLDTADADGPETVEHLIRKALHPYPPGPTTPPTTGSSSPSVPGTSHPPGGASSPPAGASSCRYAGAARPAASRSTMPTICCDPTPSTCAASSP